MKRSQILQLLARRLSNRDAEDIQEAALNEMEYVQRAVLEKLPSQPWFLARDVRLPFPQGAESVDLPEDFNTLMTEGGVWIADAILEEPAPPCETQVALPPEFSPGMWFGTHVNGDYVSEPITELFDPVGPAGGTTDSNMPFDCSNAPV